MEKNPLVSIVLPVYNGEKYLELSIKSCLHQTYKNIELIIVNDCSTDSSLLIAESYQLKDSRIKIIDNKHNLKLPASLNLGHYKSLGELCTWTSDDNIFKINAIEVMVDSLCSNNVDFVYSNYHIIDEFGNISNEVILPNIEWCLWKNVFGASFMYTKKVFDINGGYGEELFLVEDYDFWLKTITNFKIFKIEKSLYLYRKHSNNLSHEIVTNDLKMKLYVDNYIIMLTSFFNKNNIHLTEKERTFFLPFENINFRGCVYNVNKYESIFKLLSKKDVFEYNRFKNILNNKLFDLYLSNLNLGLKDYLNVIKISNINISLSIFYKLTRRLIINKYYLYCKQ